MGDEDLLLAWLGDWITSRLLYMPFTGLDDCKGNVSASSSISPDTGLPQPLITHLPFHGKNEVRRPKLSALVVLRGRMIIPSPASYKITAQCYSTSPLHEGSAVPSQDMVIVTELPRNRGNITPTSLLMPVTTRFASDKSQTNNTSLFYDAMAVKLPQSG